VQNDAEHESIKKFFKEAVEKIGAKFCEMNNLAKDIYSYQKLTDERFLSSRLMAAYEAMADTNRTKSIPLRRQRREDAVILIVEDDRFTASYASNLLNKDYDVVHAKTGEVYIEHAPDIVFLDIHLPGLDGHDTLRALRKIDPESFIIMLSVDTMKQNIVDATKGGASGFLKKPFSKERLLATVQKSPFITEPYPATCLANLSRADASSLNMPVKDDVTVELAHFVTPRIVMQ
jgi:CheY-like chemotaxis protein